MGQADAVIRVDGVSKVYRLAHKSGDEPDSLRELLAAAPRRLAQVLGGRNGRAAGGEATGGPPAGDTVEEFWALRDVSFEVKRGEVVGIIGRNGAGKSTLLKILSRITEPTAGRVTLDGRLASLLEVGTGFHPELTGRENVFMNGAVLGMTRAEVRRKFDEIVAFAGVEKFLDTPVKRYSSGMYVRLAFAVAAHLEPEILIVDEVLAVGDAEFQKRCLGKIHDVASGGRTVLFVSHNQEAVSALCTRCLLLDDGRVAHAGPPAVVQREYRRRSAGPAGGVVRHRSPRLTFTGVLNHDALAGLSPADDVPVRLGFRAGPGSLAGLFVDVALHNERNERVVHARARFVTDRFAVAAGEAFAVEYRFTSPRLAPGVYTATVYAENDGQVEYWAEGVECLSVRPTADFGHAVMLNGLTAAVVPPYEVRVIRGSAEPAQGDPC